MALKHVVETLDGIHESLHGEYTEKDGKFFLAVDGMVTADKLTEFRNTNIARGRELDELKERYKDIDPDKHRELTAQAAKIAERKLIDAGKVEELFAERLKPVNLEHTRVVEGLTAKATNATKQLEGLLIDGKLRDVALKIGITDTGVTDFLNRGRGVYRLHEGNSTAFNGNDQLYGKDGSPLGMEEWGSSLADSAPHLFKASQGGGSKGAQSGSAASGTMTRATFDKLDPMAKREALKTHKLVD